MEHRNAIPRCTVQTRKGNFCDGVAKEDLPFPICGHHALKLYRHMADELRWHEGEGGLPRLMHLAFQQVDEDREREHKRITSTRVHAPVVYYVLIGDVMKIGTSTNLRARMLTYPPHRRLLATEPGGRDVEAQRHREYSHLLTAGREWFRFEQDLAEWVQGLRAKRKAG